MKTFSLLEIGTKLSKHDSKIIVSSEIEDLIDRSSLFDDEDNISDDRLILTIWTDDVPIVSDLVSFKLSANTLSLSFLIKNSLVTSMITSSILKYIRIEDLSNSERSAEFKNCEIKSCKIVLNSEGYLCSLITNTQNT